MCSLERLLVCQGDRKRGGQKKVERIFGLSMQRVPRTNCIRIALISVLLVLQLVSCRNAPSVRQEMPAAGVDTVGLSENLFRYARNVTAVPTDYGYLMEVLNPWDATQKLGRYALVKEGCLKDDCLDGLEQISLPVSSVVSFSSTQWSMFLLMGEIGRVKGILEGRYVHDPRMKALLADGVVKDVGTESAKNIELMIQMKPDILLYSPYFDGNQDPLKVTGAVLFPFADYLETTPLGRAEWIRVIGLLIGRQHEADSCFEAIVQRYDHLKDLCADVEERPTVFSDLAFNGQWYVAGGQSYIARLFADAGADYIWKDNTSAASFPLDAETILAKARHADYWRVANSSSLPMTYSSLLKENAVYGLFDAYQNHRVIVCDIQETGYFETSQLEPDVLLADFIHFFHPERLKDIDGAYVPKYYHLMEE